jgi:PTS system mannose-specific IID component
MTRGRARWLLFLRSFLIQGSWNYRTLLGTGVAWALLPVLGRGTNGAGKPPWIPRQAASFNAHPYLTPVALGSLARVEADRADPDHIRRFRDALRGPLGSLGDGFIWGVWRPLCLVASILAGILGAPPLMSILGFLVVYNTVHIALRVWGVGVGLDRGFAVADGLRRLDVPRRTERTARLGVLILGVTSGALFGQVMGLSSSRLPLVLGGVACLGAGFLGGESRKRWGPILLVLFVLAGLMVEGGAWRTD